MTDNLTPEQRRVIDAAKGYAASRVGLLTEGEEEWEIIHAVRALESEEKDG